MFRFLKKEANKAFTENGAATYITTQSDCLDLFGTIGAMRGASEGEIIDRFLRAYTEDAQIAMKILFYGRDVRGGLGERRVFQIIIRWLAEHEPASLRKNIALIPEYGRFDDLVALMGTPCEKDALGVIRRQLEKDLEGKNEVSLLAKWLPSVNASNKDTIRAAKRIAGYLGMTDAQYRKTLVGLRQKIHLIENNLREKDYSFDYSKQPSKAMFKYRRAFQKNDKERYSEFLRKVNSGEAKLNAGTLMPYELVEPYLAWNNYYGNGSFLQAISEQEKAALNATWASLSHFANTENALAVIDTSGSMYSSGKPLPAAVALSLGLYFAEHNSGVFKNHFIAFSGRPQLIEVKGDTFADRLRYAASFSEIADTNLEAVFELILKAAVRYRVPQNQLPATLFIISDMEFNCCVENGDVTNFENAKAKYAKAGYRLPKVVFWNVASRNKQQPVTQNEQGVALVSGCSPRLFSMAAKGIVSPYTVMMEVVASERYAAVTA